MVQPQEIQVWYVIPTIRKELAIALIKNGYSQKEVAKFLNLTESAVSQYKSQKRGNELEFSAEIKVQIAESAKKIAKDKTLLMEEIQKLSKSITKSGILCDLHKKEGKDDLQDCKICFKK